ncbi:unnamed protein product [Zymoseptoria tritici ST99CH_1E4]|uniref:FAD dependent oxidoreductase domain-containing protein n=1 Tax=Zymoseptoria tritici ST99CH_1E4 TaxID=1276532 RepID=A0A2H1H027_ZYMTR|nr:unnamed protein product [Zymoseptoria tritici ST99CH_1E4]
MPQPSSPPEKQNIIIVGGGIIGCTTAYFLTRHSSYNPSTHKITLLEASTIAGGASGKAGGLLATWAYPKCLVGLSFRLHRELAEEHGGKERWGYREVGVGSVECVGLHRPATEKLKALGGSAEEGKGEDVNLQKTNALPIAASTKPKTKRKGVPDGVLEWIDADALKEYEEMASPGSTAQVHPYQFTTTMAKLAEEAGVEILTHSPVSKIEYTSNGKGVSGVTYTPSSTSSSASASKPDSVTLQANKVILSPGPWTRSLLPTAPITSIRAHSLTLRPSVPISPHALFTSIRLPKSFPTHPNQTVTPEIYPRPNDNEVYACGEGDELVPLPSLSSSVEVDPQRVEDVRAFVGSISPALADAEVTARQACYLPSVEGGAGAPLVGKTGVEGLWLAAGHSCWGIQNAPATGKVMAEMVLGEGGKKEEGKWRELDPRGWL